MKNTFVKVLSFMMALTMIVGAFGAITVSAAGCAHENLTEENILEVVEATCKSAGFTKYLCPDCNEEVIDDVTDKVATHNYVTVPATDATCTEPAYKAYKKCSICGEEDPDNPKTEAAPADGHEWTAYTETVAATCSTKGYVSPKCVVCGEIDKKNETGKYKVLNELPHEYVYTVTVAPVKCQEGLVTVTCKNCTYKKEIVQAAIHNWVTLESEGLAGYTCDEYISGNICKDCRLVAEDAVKNTNVTCTFTKVAGIGANGTDTTITDANLTAALVELGYKVGDALHVEADCSTSGYYYGYCARHNTYRKVLVSNAEIEHAFYVMPKKTAASEAEHAADCTVPAYTWKRCANCRLEVSEVKTAAKAAHEYKKEGAVVVTTIGTCTANEVKTFYCDNCDESHTEVTAYAPGHNFGEAVAPATYDCTEGYTKVKTCTNPQCDIDLDTDGKQKATEDVVVAPVAEHTFEANKYVEVGATCMTAAHYERKCTKCTFQTADGVPADKKPTDDPAARADKHVAYISTTYEGVINANENVQALSCTTDKIDRFICACGEIVDVVTAEALGHTTADAGRVTCDLNNDGDTTDAGEDLSAVTADCKTASKTEGKFCGRCSVIVKAQVVGAVDPENHKNAGVLVESADATCSAYAYTKSYYSCCGFIHKIENKKAGYDEDNHDLEAKAEVARTCTANGTKAHSICKDCGKIFIEGVEKTPADLVIKNPGEDFAHKFPTTLAQEYVAEKCDETGIRAYYQCEDCTAIKIQETGAIVMDDANADNGSEKEKAYTIAAHGNVHMGYYSSLNKAATCTTDGVEYPATYCCKLCDKKVLPKTECEGTTAPLYINLAKDAEDEYTVVVDCTKPTYVLNICSACGKSSMANYKAAAKTAHEYTKANNVEVADTTVAPTCTEAGVKYFECKNCEYVDERAGDAATGHYTTVNGVKVTISAACTEIAGFDGWVCEGCGGTVDKDVDGYVVETETVEEETTEAPEEVTTEASEEATTEAPEVDTEAGANTPETASVEVITIITIGAEHKHVTSHKEATCSAAGHDVEYCADCNKIFSSSKTPAINHEGYKYLKETKAPTATEEGYNKYVCKLCGEEFVETIPATPTINISAVASATTVAAGATVDVTIKVSAESVKLNNMEIALNLGGKFAITDVELVNDFGTSVHVDAGEGKVILVVENDAEGKPVNVTIEGEIALVKVTLKALNFASGKTAIVPSITSMKYYKEDGKEAAIGLKVAATKAEVTVTGLGNLNGDTIVGGAGDLQALKTMILAQSTNASADINGDGAVNLADFAALSKFAVSKQTALDYVVMTGEDLDAVIASVKLPDLNKDGVANVNDEIKLANEVEARLTAMTYNAYLDGKYDSLADYVAVVIADLVK